MDSSLHSAPALVLTPSPPMSPMTALPTNSSPNAATLDSAQAATASEVPSKQGQQLGLWPAPDAPNASDNTTPASSQTLSTAAYAITTITTTTTTTSPSFPSSFPSTSLLFASLPSATTSSPAVFDIDIDIDNLLPSLLPSTVSPSQPPGSTVVFDSKDTIDLSPSAIPVQNDKPEPAISFQVLDSSALLGISDTAPALTIGTVATAQTIETFSILPVPDPNNQKVNVTQPPSTTTATASAIHSTPSRFIQASSIGLCQSPVRLLVVPLSFKFENHPHLNHLNLDLGYFQTWSFQSLFVAYSIPILLVLTPGLILPIGIFQVLTLIAQGNNNIQHSLHSKQETSLSSSSSSLPSPHPFLKRGAKRSMDGSTSGSNNPSSHTGGHSASMLSAAGTTTQHDGGSHHPHHMGQPTSGTGGRSLLAQNAGGASGPSLASSNHIRHSQANGGNNHSQHFGDHESHHDEDEDEDDQSESSDGEPRLSDIEFYLQRCSICFDARLDFCLDYCRDQFCQGCFLRYVKEVVSNSWGLNVTKIKCPVCQDVIQMSEWNKYVDQPTLALYQKYNQPYRSFSRFCNDCGHEVAAARIRQEVLGLAPTEFEKPLVEIFEALQALLRLGGLVGIAVTSSNKRKVTDTSLKRERAAAILTKFESDIKAYCGITQTVTSNSSSGSSNNSFNAAGSTSSSQSFLSQLASRSHTQASSTVPAPVNSTSANTNSASLPWNSRQTALSTQPSHFLFTHQRRYLTSTPASGILEMYKPLLTSLLEIFDLQEVTGTGSAAKGSHEDENESDDDSDHESDSVLDGDNDFVMQAAPASGRSVSIEAVLNPLEVPLSSRSPEILAISPKGRKRSKSLHAASRQRPAKIQIMTRAQHRRRETIMQSLVQLSKDLGSLETRVEQWKELQFLHVRWLRWDTCEKCQSKLCMQCGESTHHEGQSCFSFMKSMSTTNYHSRDVAFLKPQSDRDVVKTEKGKSKSKSERLETPSPTPVLDMSTIHWKLQNTNPCPNCCILIHRDDGCNKVDCMLCGYRFCWVCREAWGTNCGFYKCGQQSIEPSSSLLPEKNNAEEMEEDSLANSAGGSAGTVDGLSVANQVGPETLAVSQPQSATLSPIPTTTVRQNTTMAASVSTIMESGSSLGSTVELVMEKPEIGVPNVFVIQAKRSRIAAV